MKRLCCVWVHYFAITNRQFNRKGSCFISISFASKDATLAHYSRPDSVKGILTKVKYIYTLIARDMQHLRWFGTWIWEHFDAICLHSLHWNFIENESFDKSLAENWLFKYNRWQPQISILCYHNNANEIHSRRKNLQVYSGCWVVAWWCR